MNEPELKPTKCPKCNGSPVIARCENGHNWTPFDGEVIDPLNGFPSPKEGRYRDAVERARVWFKTFSEWVENEKLNGDWKEQFDTAEMFMRDALSASPDEPQRDAYKERWKRLKAWLGEDWTMRGWVPLPGNVIEKMDDLESQPANEGE